MSIAGTNEQGNETRLTNRDLRGDERVGGVYKDELLHNWGGDIGKRVLGGCEQAVRGQVPEDD